jgi:hypothetical protein
MMRCKTSLLAGCGLLTFSLGWALAQPEADSPPFKSQSVRTGRTAYDAALEKAREEYASKAGTARKKYLEILDLATRQATRDGDLDEANRLKAESELVAAEDFTDDFPSLFGAWRVRWNQDLRVRYEFHRDGRVVRETWREEPARGQLRKANDDLVIDFPNGELVRVNLAGPRLILEWYERSGSYPADYPGRYGTGVSVRN